MRVRLEQVRVESPAEASCQKHGGNSWRKRQLDWQQQRQARQASRQRKRKILRSNNPPARHPHSAPAPASALKFLSPPSARPKSWFKSISPSRNSKWPPQAGAEILPPSTSAALARINWICLPPSSRTPVGIPSSPDARPAPIATNSSAPKPIPVRSPKTKTK